LHQLVVHLERSLAIEIPDEDTGRFITVTDIQTVLDRLGRRLKGTTP
jgi:acyl carrier protein